MYGHMYGHMYGKIYGNIWEYIYLDIRAAVDYNLFPAAPTPRNSISAHVLAEMLTLAINLICNWVAAGHKSRTHRAPKLHIVDYTYIYVFL